MSKMKFPGSQTRFEKILSQLDKAKSYGTPDIENYLENLNDAQLNETLAKNFTPNE